MILKTLRNPRLQRGAEIVMVLGIIALCQPWSMLLHRYGLTIIIAGLLTFMITGWVGSEPNPQGIDPRETDPERAHH